MSTEVEDSRPPPPEWINKDLVQKALRSGDGDQTITVVSTEVRMANAVGDGYASDMYRVTAQLEDGSTRSVIIKCQPQGGKREEIVRIWGAFTIEQNMLTKTLPAMFKLLEEANPGKYSPFSAKCLYHGDEPTKYLVLEDLRASDFTLAKRQEGVNMEHCSLVMKSLARFHASSIALRVRDPEAMDYYAESVYGEPLRENIEDFMQSSMRSLAYEVNKWPDYKDKYVDKLNKLSHTFFDRIVEICRRKEGGFNVLVHCDPWTSNMMFKYTDGKVADLRLVDFQTAHYSSPALDIHYFLSTCPNVQVRKHNIDQLLEEYITALNQTLDELGCSDHQISQAVLNKELDERAYFALYAAATVLPIVLSNPEDGFNIEEAMGGDRENLKSTKTLYASEAYKNAMSILLPMFENKGLI